MIIARVKDGIVVNVEVADQDWVDSNQGVDGFTLVPVPEGTDKPPFIGLGWDEQNGFEQLVIVPDNDELAQAVEEALANG